MLTVAVLGPVDVRRDDVPIGVPTGRTTEVLIRLALAAGELVPAERILEELWADTASGVGKNTLQSKVSQLRRALGDAAPIISGHGGYRFAVDPSYVDALLVVDLTATAHELRCSGQLTAAVEASARALALFRGTALPDAGDGEWVQPHRAQLEQVRVALLEDQLAAKVLLGTGSDVIGQLETLVTQFPLREALWYWLITALYHNGRQADALAAYAHVRKILVEELGLEPGRELQELETQVLQQTLEKVAAPTDRVISAPAAVGNLPRSSSPLIGREADLAAIGAHLREERLVTLVGTPGVGKTRLAIEVARQAAAEGGCWLVRLDAINTQKSLPQLLAETMKLPSEQAVIDRFAGTPTLLLFDNCEHVVEAAAELVDRLLDATTGLRVLATSQLPLGVDGESVYPLPPLAEAESVQLFAKRATEIRPRWAADGADDVAKLCGSLDGLPLAIELAAARVKSLSVQEISRRLDSRFDLLQDPTSRRPERRRALAAAIGWSYDLLFPDDQRGLWGLSCFTGGAPLAAVENVLAVFGVPAAAAVDVVSRLVDRSLVQMDVTDSGTIRYRLLDSIRLYAADRLQESPFRDAAVEAHATWYADNAEHCAETVRGSGQPQCVAFAQSERANIDAALAWSAEHRPNIGVRIANGFGWTWVVLGDGVAGATRLRAALSAGADQVSDRDRAETLLIAGWLEASAGNLDRAYDDLDQAAVATTQLAPPVLQQLTADIHRHRAFLGLQQGRPVDALAAAEQGIADDRLLGRSWEQAAGLVLAASASMMLGDTSGAASRARAALMLLEPIGDSWGLVHGEAMLGAIAQAEHRFDDAAGHLARAAASSHQLGFLGQEAYHLTRLGRVQQQAGDDHLATETLYRAIRAANDDGDLRMAATARINLARVLRGTKRNQDAITLLEQTNDWYRRSGAGDGALLSRMLLAAIRAPDATASRLGEIESLLDEARLVNNHEVEVLALDALARLAADAGAMDRAGQLLQLADNRNAENRTRVDEFDRFDARQARGAR